MREESISVTEAARNFSDCINRVRYQGTTFILHKNGVPVARIVPEERKRNTGRELPEALANVQIPKEEAEAGRQNLDEVRHEVLPPVDL